MKTLLSAGTPGRGRYYLVRTVCFIKRNMMLSACMIFVLLWGLLWFRSLFRVDGVRLYTASGGYIGVSSGVGQVVAGHFEGLEKKTSRAIVLSSMSTEEYSTELHSACAIAPHARVVGSFSCSNNEFVASCGPVVFRYVAFPHWIVLLVACAVAALAYLRSAHRCARRAQKRSREKGSEAN